MGRVIKFRAWDKIGKNMWYYGEPEFHSDLSGYSGEEIFTKKDNIEYYPLYDKPKIKLMQFTGLKDKNKEEIYEGDIVKQEMPSNEVWEGEVVFEQGAFRINIGDIYNKDLIGGLCEIIGNIYENPELLNQ